MNKNWEIVKYAYQNINFYKKNYAEILGNTTNLNDNIFKTLPILDKHNVIQNYDDIIDTHIIKRDIKALTTSGTSGKPIRINWLNSDYIKSNFYTWNLRRKWYNIFPSDKFCTFHSSLTDGKSSVIQDVLLYGNGRILSFGRYLYSEQILKKYVSLMQKFKPKWILGQPSVIYILAQYIKNNNISINSIRYIELNGEYVDNSILNAIREVFNVPVSNLYGAVEFNGIALTCPHGNMHIINNNVYVENIKKDLISQIIVTGLVNRYMPLIRYNIGDVGTVTSSRRCNCGYSGDILEVSKGRVHELISFNSNTKLDPSIFMSIVDEINIENNIVLQFCLLIDKNKITLQLLIDEKYKKHFKLKENYYLHKLSNLNAYGISYDLEVTTDEKEMLNGESKFTFIKKR